MHWVFGRPKRRRGDARQSAKNRSARGFSPQKPFFRGAWNRYTAIVKRGRRTQSNARIWEMAAEFRACARIAIKPKHKVQPNFL